MEWLLTKTIEAGRTSGAVEDTSLDEIAVDTIVMEKNIAHPTDSRLYDRARAQLVDLAQEAGIDLRQSYARLAPRLAAQVGRYAHAKQFRRMRKALRTLKRAVVARGYKGHGVQHTQVLISGTRRGLTPALAKALRRRSSIEPEIGHMETDGRLARCFLKGAIGDALFAVFCGCGHNIRKILAHLRKLLAAVITLVLAMVRQERARGYSHAAASADRVDALEGGKRSFSASRHGLRLAKRHATSGEVWHYLCLTGGRSADAGEDHAEPQKDNLQR